MTRPRAPDAGVAAGLLPERRGTAYIEAIVASVVFAITMTGLCATIVAQEKLMRAIEQRVHVVAPVGLPVIVRAVPRSDDNVDLYDEYGHVYEAVAVPTGYLAEAPVAPTILGRARALMTRQYPESVAGLRIVDGRRGQMPAAGWRTGLPSFDTSRIVVPLPAHQVRLNVVVPEASSTPGELSVSVDEPQPPSPPADPPPP